MEFFIDPFSLPFMGRALGEALILGALGGIVGVFVVLRRLSFMADAFTHTIFPGVVIGFLVGQTNGILWGALISAALSAVIFTVMDASRRVTADSSLAIILTGFFAIGIALVSQRSSYSSDLTTFLFGRILTVDQHQLIETVIVAVIALAILVALRKEFLLRAFDPQAAAAMGYSTLRLDLVMNIVIALVVVAAVKAVGTILVVALLIVPAAAARMLSDRLSTVLGISVLCGMLSGWLGLAISYDFSVRHDVRLAAGGTIVLILVGFYVIAAVVGWLRYKHKRTSMPKISMASSGETRELISE